MSEFVDRVEADILSRRLVRPRDRILLAVSGGLDSMVLLDLMHRLAGRHRWTLGIAHFNHHLRGADSLRDETLVRVAARNLKLPFTRGQGNVQAAARRQGISVEMAGRNLRHQFLARVANRDGWNRLALAHQADDQVELFFLRLLRGAGPEGLAGMPWSGPSPADPALTLIRPLLGQSRATLEQHARVHRLAFHEDSTNRDTDILRNRIRHRLLPYLVRECQPALPRVILRTMEILRAESDVLEAAARKWSAGRNRRGFPHLLRGLQRRIVLDELLRAGIPPAFDVVERLLEAPGQPVQISPGLRLSLSTEGRLRRAAAARPIFSGRDQRVALRGRSGTVEFGGLRIWWSLHRRLPARAIRPGTPGIEWFDARSVGPAITLRHWRRGDRFQPLGMAAPCKLQDLFVNSKVPKALRHQRVVATGAGGILFWVEGLRIADPAKVTRSSACYLQWRWQRAHAPADTAVAPPDSEVAG